MTTGPYRSKPAERIMDFFDFIFTWVGRAWAGLMATLGSAWFGLWRTFALFEFWLAVVLGAMTALTVKVATTDGKIDYCYVDSSSNSPRYRLIGHRPWRIDVELASTVNSDTAPLYELAKKIECPIR